MSVRSHCNSTVSADLPNCSPTAIVFGCSGEGKQRPCDCKQHLPGRLLAERRPCSGCYPPQPKSRRADKWTLWICVAEGPLDGGSSNTPSGKLSHVWKVKPHAAIGRILHPGETCAPMERRGRGLPSCRKETQPDQRPAQAHCIPLWSGAQREDVQMQVEGSEGGMTSGAFSQNALRTGVYEAARGSRCPNCAAFVWEKDNPGMT